MKTTTDPISDMLTRIRNAIAVHKNEISLPHSNIKESVARVLVEQTFLDSVKVEGEGIDKQLIVTINRPETSARITEIVRLSTPGRRDYRGADKIPSVKHGRGVVVVSTSRGIMTGQQARRQKVGGELICKVY